MAELKSQQKTFCDEYIKCGNATQAYMLAYPTAKESVARANASRLMKNANIVAYIKKRSEAQQIAEDKAIAESVDEGKIANMKEIKEFWSSILRDKNQQPSARLKASEYIAKTNGAFIDKVEHSGNTGVTIINDIPRNKTK